jgi:hypothetical protein
MAARAPGIVVAPWIFAMTLTFRILAMGQRQPKPRLESEAVLQEADFRAIARSLAEPVIRARKTGLISARRARTYETIETHWNGIETTNTARPGDWIVTNLTAKGRVLRDREGHVNAYVISGKRFPELYAPAQSRAQFGATYRAKSVVSAIRLRGGFDIKAPWGERQRARAGYLLLSGKDVYGCNAATFAATYEVITD